MIKLFITATDTDAGKTLMASAITYQLSQQFKVAVFKPVSAGCEMIDNELINEDALLLQKYANSKQPIKEINPIAFLPAIAPHIAAAHDNKAININDITAAYEKIVQNGPDVVITEGAGGWRLPLGNNVFLSELAQCTSQQVVLVVNMKLGCLNHALLTHEAIIKDGLKCVGWIANCQSDMPYLNENIKELTMLIHAPLLGVVGIVDSVEEAAKQLDISPLLNA